MVPNFHLGLRQALNRFLETGHRHIAFLGSFYTLQRTHDWLLDARLYYFRNILQEEGVYDPALEVDSGMTSPQAYQALGQALQRWQTMPDALFISSDAMVQGHCGRWTKQNCAFRRISVSLPSTIRLFPKMQHRPFLLCGCCSMNWWWPLCMP